MPTTVFPLVPAWPFQQGLEFDTFVADMGSGFEQRACFNQGYTRANGEGVVTGYRGRNKFTLRIPSMAHNVDAATLWAFYKARKGTLEAFYLYNVPDECASIDLTGAATTGRYLVRFADAALSREKFTLKLYRVGITMLEVRS